MATREWRSTALVVTRMVTAFSWVLAVGCGGDAAPPAPAPTTPTPTPPTVASVVLASDSVDVAVGATIQLGATARDAQGNILAGRAAVWSSADPTVASVSSNGTVTGVSAGRVLIAVDIEGRNATARVRVRGVADTLTGAASAPAVAAIPLRVAQTRDQDYLEGHPDFPRLPISINTVMVLLEPTATIGAVNVLLRSLDATVLGGVPGLAGQLPTMLVLRVPTRTHAELTTVLGTLRASSVVRAAVQESRLSTDVVTRTSADASGASWRWNTTVLLPTQGNWGLKDMRVPQLWNFNALVERDGAAIMTGVFDEGFAVHPDLVYAQNLTPNDSSPKSHGTHVAGTIAATFNNGIGIDGVNPFTRLTVRGGASLSNLITGLADLLINGPPMRVVNVSLGYNWGKQNINTNASDAARQYASNQGLMVYAVLATVQQVKGRLPVIVAAAGNDRTNFSGQNARHASPFNAAALTHGAKSIIVVEAIEPIDGGGAQQAAFSNDAGQLSAPGVLIMSTVPTANGVSYQRKDGTSMATPNVSGVVGYLYALDPAFPDPTLSTNPILDVLRATARPASNASPRVDAFAAALEVDRIRGGDRILRGLLDIDDGTLDGNTRIDLATGQVIATDGATARDGRIDMRDFRRFRDALAQVEDGDSALLNGALDHPKRNLNGDNSVGSAAEENVFPRFDFNGDGKLSRTATARMAGVFAGAELTDLGVLQRLFNDADVEKSALPDLLSSGDIDMHPTACLAIPNVTSVRATLRRGESPAFRVVDLTPSVPRMLRTERSSSDTVTARLEARNATGDIVAYHERPIQIRSGSDHRLDGECFRLDVSVSFPLEPSSGTPQPLQVTVTRAVPRLGTTAPAANADVVITAIGGVAAATSGRTNAAGEFATSVTPTVGGTSVTVIIEIKTPSGSTSSRVTRPIAGALPCASGTSANEVLVSSDAGLAALSTLGRVNRSLSIDGTFSQFVDLRRFCSAGINLLVEGTFNGGLRLDAIESTGAGTDDPFSDGAVNNDFWAGSVRLFRVRGVAAISLPRLRYVGIPISSNRNGLFVEENPDLVSLTVGREVAILEITQLFVKANPRLTTLTVVPEIRLPSLAKWLPSSTNRRVETIEVRNNAALQTATFAKITAFEMRVRDNAALRTLTIGAGSAIDRLMISGNPLLEQLNVPCTVLNASTITIKGNPALQSAVTRAARAECRGGPDQSIRITTLNSVGGR